MFSNWNHRKNCSFTPKEGETSVAMGQLLSRCEVDNLSLKDEYAAQSYEGTIYDFNG